MIYQTYAQVRIPKLSGMTKHMTAGAMHNRFQTRPGAVKLMKVPKKRETKVGSFLREGQLSPPQTVKMKKMKLTMI